MTNLHGPKCPICQCYYSARGGASCYCDEARERSRLPYLSPSTSILEIRDWTIEFGESGSPKHTHLIPPQGELRLRGFSEVGGMRPARLAISTVAKARLSVSMVICTERYPLGNCDTWHRLPGQLPTAFIRELKNVPTLGPANQIEVRIINRYRIKGTWVSVQIDGAWKR
jgi:hypothetical protein